MTHPKFMLQVWEDAVTDVFASFYESAIGLSFAIQLACFIIISAQDGRGLGGNGITLQLAWFISAATLLPLLTPTLLLRSRESAVRGQPKGRLRAALAVVISVLLATYAASKMTIIVLLSMSDALYSSGDPSDPLPTKDEDETITSLCFPTNPPSNTPAIQVVALIGWLLMTLLIMAPALTLAVNSLVSALHRNNTKREQKKHKFLRLWETFDGQNYPVLSFVAIALPGAISVAILVEAYQLRRMQQRASGTLYTDNEWGFGQIAAIAMYGPVLLEVIATVIDVWKRVRGYRKAVRRDKHNQAARGELGLRRIKTI